MDQPKSEGSHVEINRFITLQNKVIQILRHRFSCLNKQWMLQTWASKKSQKESMKKDIKLQIISPKVVLEMC